MDRYLQGVTRYSLWRGSQRLGEFDERRPILGDNQRVVGATGLLSPSVPASALTSTWQLRSPSGGFVEHALEPIRFGKDGLGADTSRQVVLLRPVPAEVSRSFPEDRVLRVKDESGAELETKSVKLQQVSVAAGVPITAVHRARGLSEEAREVWAVTFEVDEPED